MSSISSLTTCGDRRRRRRYSCTALAQILGLLLLERRVRVARHAEGVLPDHAHPGEQTIEVRRDDLLDRHEALPVGHDHEPRQQRRHLHARDPLIPPAPGSRDDHGEVEGEVADVGERMGGVDGERGEHREDPVLEDRVDVPAVLAIERVVVGEAKADLSEPLCDRSEGEHLTGHQLDRPGADLRELLVDRHAIGAERGDPRPPLLDESTHANLEELVEVAARDGDELRALEQRA